MKHDSYPPEVPLLVGTPSGGALRGTGSLEGCLDAAVEGMLAIARRETLVVAAARQVNDRDAVLVASGRLRWSLACAQQFAARSHAALIRLRPRLLVALDAAERWLPEGMDDAVPPERLRRLIKELREPSVGLRAICADDTLIVAFDLDDLPLAQITLRGATIARVSARRARLDAADATRAKIFRSTFHAASLRRSIFDEGVLEGCDLSNTNLEGTTWRNASLTRCTARGAVFLNADLEGTRFVDCDLKDTDFQAMPETTSRGAEFLRCDLRESNWSGRGLSRVSFIDCKMYGVHGCAPGQDETVDETVIERPDVSHAGDGSRIVTKRELLAIWQLDDWTSDCCVQGTT